MIIIDFPKHRWGLLFYWPNLETSWTSLILSKPWSMICSWIGKLCIYIYNNTMRLWPHYFPTPWQLYPWGFLISLLIDPLWFGQFLVHQPYGPHMVPTEKVRVFFGFVCTFYLWDDVSWCEKVLKPACVICCRRDACTIWLEGIHLFIRRTGENHWHRWWLPSTQSRCGGWHHYRAGTMYYVYLDWLFVQSSDSS